MIANFKKKQKTDPPPKFFVPALFKLFFLLIIVFLIFENFMVYKERKKLNFQLDSLQAKIREIQNKNAKLKEGIDNADDESYIEKIAREELDLQKQDEKVITFIMPEPKQEENTNSSGNFLNMKTWLGRFYNSWQWILDFSN